MKTTADPKRAAWHTLAVEVARLACEAGEEAKRLNLSASHEWFDAETPLIAYALELRAVGDCWLSQVERRIGRGRVRERYWHLDAPRSEVLAPRRALMAVPAILAQLVEEIRERARKQTEETETAVKRLQQERGS